MMIQTLRILNDSAFGAEPERPQASPIPDSPIPENAMAPPRQTQPPRDPVSDDQSSQPEETWENDEDPSAGPAEQPPATITVRRRNRRPAPPTDRETRTPKGKAPRPDYKKLQTPRQFQSKGRANVVNNTYNAKQVPGSHIHMVRALHALNSGESFGLGHISEPLNYREARKSPHWEEWKTAMETEVASLVENGTWELVKRPPGRAVITGRWVFKLKYGVDGRILRYKARWVVHGYKQKEGIDYNATWAGVVKPASFRTLFALAAERRLHAEQMDIVTAFLYGLLDEDVYVTQPEGFVEDPALVCHLIKALYGLKQAPRVWYGVISAFLKELGLVTSEADHSVFISRDGKTYVAVYVDDLLIISDSMNLIDSMKQELGRRFKMTDLGPAQHYLGIEVVRNGDSILLRQTTYLRKVLERFGMDKCKVVGSPMDPGLASVMMPAKEGQQAHPDTLYWYGSAVGSLLYAASMTRPDLSYALSMVSRYCSNPDSTHVAALLRIFRYVQGTLDHGIGYEPGQEFFHGYSDADWANSIDGRRSHGGFIFFLAGGPVSWFSKRQNTVALSSCESEYYALVEAGKEAVWFRQLLMELGCIVDSEPSLIYADNQGAIALSENPEHHKRTKHIANKWHWIRQAIEEHTIQMEYVPTALMAADGLTKPLGPSAFQVFLNLIGMAY